MSKTIVLAGNPNSGKTTLFNQLTGSSQYVGNWPGVTVEKKEGSLRSHKQIKILDLPGIYSLTGSSIEEVIASEQLTSGNGDLILNIVDGTNLERNLYLTTQLIELGLPMVICINMADILSRYKSEMPDFEKLSSDLGCPVLPISAKTGQGLKALTKVLVTALEEGLDAPRIPIYDTSLLDAIGQVEQLLSSRTDFDTHLSYHAVRALEGNESDLSLSQVEKKNKVHSRSASRTETR